MVNLGKVLVVGGGVGGMAAALQLTRAGYAVDLVEADAKWRTQGAGITVLASALRALSVLGFLDQVLEAGWFAHGICLRNAAGTVLRKRPGMRLPDLDVPSGGGILRPVLHRIMSSAVLEAGVGVRLGISYGTFHQTSDAVEVEFTDGSSDRYGLVVAADGLYSTLRSLLFPAVALPRFTGQGCWRLVTARPAEIDCSNFFVGGKVTAGMVPVSKEEMYLWVLESVPDNPWVPPERQHELLGTLLEEFGGLIGDIRASLQSSSRINYRPLEFLLAPAPWSAGRILLIGDAAHATTPHLASGAGMAMEDGIVLADVLRHSASLPAALAVFMQRRYERCRLVVENSVAIGQVEIEHQPPEVFEQLMTASHLAIARPF